MEKNENITIILTKERHDELIEAELILKALKDSGIEKYPEYAEAMELVNQRKGLYHVKGIQYFELGYVTIPCPQMNEPPYISSEILNTINK